MDYRGYKITAIFFYGFWLFDFEYYEIDNPENSGLAHRATLQAVKEDIDDRILEREMIWI